MARPRILLVEDDPAIQRFTQLAVEDLPLDLLTASSVADALALLAEGPVRLVLTDLMLPGESGQVLLQRLREQPALAAGARLAVYSAGLNPRVRAALEPLGVWRLLDKPVPLQALRRCVEDALAEQPASATGAAPAPPPGAGAAAAQAIATYFGGNESLYRSYLRACLAQFPHDADAGAAALRAGDLAALHRLAHSLKSVLRTLGQGAAADTARALESATAKGDAPAMQAHWLALEATLRQSPDPRSGTSDS